MPDEVYEMDENETDADLPPEVFPTGWTYWILLFMNGLILAIGIAGAMFFHWAGWKVSVGFLVFFVLAEFAYKHRYGDWF